MEDIRKDIVSAIGDVLREWYPIQADKIVQGEAAVTVAVGKARLANLKKEVTQLVERAEKVADERVKGKALWWHLAEGEGMEDRSPSFSPYRVYSGGVIPRLLEAPLRRAFGALASVLEPYGYLRTQSSPPGYRWRESKDYAYPGTGSGALPYFKDYLPVLPDAVPQLIQQYDELYAKARDALAKIGGQEAAKQSAEAKHLWDQS